MEQKQLDELDESFLSEEFIDEESVFEEAEEKPALKPTPKFEKKEKKMEKKIAPQKAKVIPLNRKSEKVVKSDSHKDEITITPVREHPKEPLSRKQPEVAVVKSVEKTVELSTPPVNPWAEEKNSAPVSPSLWKVVAGVAVMLLLLSVFTQGFQFSGPGSSSGEILPLAEAESKALDYVNTNLLKPPFVAEVENSKEVAGLYQFTLTVAGQSVDSYMTKDGRLFFPQGFDVDSAVVDPTSETALDDNSAVEVPVSSPSEVSGTAVAVEKEHSEDSTPTTLTPADSAPEQGVVSLTLDAKKWLFNPNFLSVKKGDKVVLTVVPQDLEFTFVIPGLGIKEKVTGKTTVEFTASKQGTFEFSCESCEDWRGMVGTLVVQ